MNIAQAVVAGMAAAELELDLARNDVQFVSRLSGAFNSRDSASIHQKPALWRVASYSGPGLPRPTNSLIMFCEEKSGEGGVA